MSLETNMPALHDGVLSFAGAFCSSCCKLLRVQNEQSDTKAEELWVERVTEFLIRSQHLEPQS